MAEPLKNQFGPEIPRRIARMIGAQHASFPQRDFVADALRGYEELDLMARGRHLANTLRQHLPRDYAAAIEILLASLGPKPESTDLQGMAPFLYLPHVVFVSEFGLDHFELSMRAQYELTQRFTAEFSIRAYLQRHPEQTLARLREWIDDPNLHVRRLVSEGTRPRLPWAPRLREFQKDPRAVLALLELLKDDPELYVRRSVANNLNDIGKDHPELLFKTCRRWMKNASPERAWLVRHALRSALKRAETGALDVLGYGADARVALRCIRVTPQRARAGDDITLAFELSSTHSQAQQILVDFRVFYMKANGKARPKVFKLKAVELAPRATIQLSKTISLREMTTRKHYPGVHRIEIVLNGRPHKAGEFILGSNTHV